MLDLWSTNLILRRYGWLMVELLLKKYCIQTGFLKFLAKISHVFLAYC